MSSSTLEEDVAELFIRVDAVEARQDALDARHRRVERVMTDIQSQLQQISKYLVAINQRFDELKR